MKLIDIDRIHYMESHIFYIKEFDASVVVMDNRMQVRRYPLRFSIEYKPVGDIGIVLKNKCEEIEPVTDKIIAKIRKMDQDGKFVNE